MLLAVLVMSFVPSSYSVEPVANDTPGVVCLERLDFTVDPNDAFITAAPFPHGTLEGVWRKGAC